MVTVVAVVLGCVMREVCTENKENVKHQEQLLQLTGSFSGRCALRGKAVRHPGWLPELVGVFSLRYILRKKKQVSIKHIIQCVL